MGRKENNGALSAATDAAVGGDEAPPVVVVPMPSLEADVVTDDEQPAEAATEEEQREAPPSEAEAEAARLKALNAVLVKEIMERRAEVATLTALIEELSIAAVATEEDQQSAVSEQVGKKLEKKKPAKKAPVKKAPARPVRAHKAEDTAASAQADQGGVPANASVAGQELEAGRGTRGRSMRMKKPNSLYASDIWIR